MTETPKGEKREKPTQNKKRHEKQVAKQTTHTHTQHTQKKDSLL